MRIRVVVDVRVPLKKRKKLMTPSGKFFYAKFKYEKLTLFCFLYGRLGMVIAFAQCELEAKGRS